MGPDWLSSLALGAADLIYRKPFLRVAGSPCCAQDAALRTILRDNRETEFGRDHGFDRLETREAFRAAVPVQTYESLKDSIRRQAEERVTTLTRDPPVFYARTSGTTGPARDFPVNAAAQRVQRNAQRILAASIHRGSAFFSGQVAGFSGAYVEGKLPSGQPFGSASGQTYATTPAFLRRRFVVPRAAHGLERQDEKYHLYALSALAAPDLTGLIAANPSTIASIVRRIQDSAESLLRDLADGTFMADAAPSPEARRAAQEARTAQPQQARRLERALAGGLRLDAIWPRLAALATWTGGNCRVALDGLKPFLPPGLTTIEIGYRASELVGTINIDVQKNDCLPALQDSVFEFVEQEKWEANRPDFLWLDEIEEGRRYYLFATTCSGLYRYDINDIVEVVGRYGDCPGLRFVQKGAGVTNITGEKLHESQLLDAVRQTTTELGIRPAFFVALADAEAATYRLYHETESAPPSGLAERLAEGLDRALAERNIEYAAKRASARLGGPRVVLLAPGAGEALKRHKVASGQRDAQYKTQALSDSAGWSFDFGPFAWKART